MPIRALPHPRRYSLSVVFNPNEKLFGGNIGWHFSGDRGDWGKLEAEIAGFQADLVAWFQRHPKVVHKESTYWDGKM